MGGAEEGAHGSPLRHHRGPIRGPKEGDTDHNRDTTGAEGGGHISSRDTTGAPSGHYRDTTRTPPGHAQDTIGTPSAQHRHTTGDHTGAVTGPYEEDMDPLQGMPAPKLCEQLREHVTHNTNAAHDFPVGGSHKGLAPPPPILRDLVRPLARYATLCEHSCRSRLCSGLFDAPGQGIIPKLADVVPNSAKLG